MGELAQVRYGTAVSTLRGQYAAISAHDFEATLARLKQAIADADLRLLHEIDPQLQLGKGGFAIPPMRQYLFFHPRYMARILAADPRAAIETPLKLTVMTLADGSVLARGADPEAAFSVYAGLQGLGAELSELCRGLLATIAAGAPH